MYRTEVDFYRAGEPGRVHLGLPWMKRIWRLREELQLQPKAEFVQKFYDRMVDTTRFEVGVFKVTGSGAEELCACAVVSFDDDLHVGITLSVEVAYSNKRGAGIWLMREFQNLARSGGAKTIRMVRRVGPYNYNVRYVKVPEIQE